MSEKHESYEFQEGAGLYEIRLKGHLTDRWADLLGNITIKLEDDGITLISLQVLDQAALHGLLKRVRDIGMPLLSINYVDPRKADTEEVIS